jgi:molecular chaperone HscB
MQSQNKFGIDVKELRNRFLRMQSQWHPDLFANKSAQERQESELVSTSINKAYNALKDPLSRAHHMVGKSVYGS